LNLLGVPVKIPVASTLLSATGGGMFDWRDERSGLLASFVRRVSDGVGLLGAVEMEDAVLHLRRKLSQRWEANVDGEVTRDTLLNQPGTDNFQVLELGAGVRYALREHSWIRLQYQRLHNIGGSQPSENLLLFGNHNRVTVSIERNFILPIGR
jgi:hypothetical protein